MRFSFGVRSNRVAVTGRGRGCGKGFKRFLESLESGEYDSCFIICAYLIILGPSIIFKPISIRICSILVII